MGREAYCIPAEICEFLLDGQSAVFVWRAWAVAAVTYLVDALESHDGDCLRVVRVCCCRGVAEVVLV
jgi:hypothetical protein